MKNAARSIALSFCLATFFAAIAQDNASLKAYNNYDFVPGETLLFEDNFHDSKDGEFPPRWNLKGGQGAINLFNGEPCFAFTEGSVGSMAKIEPAMKKKNYLSNSFTIEFDFYLPTVDEMVVVYLRDNDGEEGRFISFESNGSVKANYFENDPMGKFPGFDEFGNIAGAWHHAAIAFKDRQMKCYIDQHRILVVPNCGFQPVALMVGSPMNTRIKNVKIAEGGGMNMLGKILTDGKFVSHAIKFDVNKSTIKGESMGFLNELAKWLKANPTIKLEIGGHTDSDGEDAANMKLSQARADEVKKQLVAMGIDASRLNTKGYGESKPIDKNDSPEGKANNRRVEFVKL